MNYNNNGNQDAWPKMTKTVTIQNVFVLLQQRQNSQIKLFYIRFIDCTLILETFTIANMRDHTALHDFNDYIDTYKWILSSWHTDIFSSAFTATQSQIYRNLRYWTSTEWLLSFMWNVSCVMWCFFISHGRALGRYLHYISCAHFGSIRRLTPYKPKCPIEIYIK